MGAATAQRAPAKVVDAKWQQAWREANSFTTPQADPSRADCYVFVPAPFTSGDAHIGHLRGYAIADAFARYRRAQGDAVLFSLGFDAFGLPAEVGAAERRMTPAEWVSRCVATMRERFDELGLSFDWERSFVTSSDDMYRWSQRLFLLLYEAGLIYRQDGYVDYCDNCDTALAISQAPGGKCWRCECDARLERRTQWYLRLSAYNEENERRLAQLGAWSESALTAQRALLGRVEGIEFDVTGTQASLTVFTEHPDSISDAEFIAISPRHPDLLAWAGTEGVDDRLSKLLASHSRADRSAQVVGMIDTGVVVYVPGVPRALPVIVSPVVDFRYGPTAVLGIPSVDRSDQSIAERLADVQTPAWQVKAPLVKRPAVRYRAGDFAVSRQRAWGAPIPVVHCDECGIVPVPIAELPVALPGGLGSPDGATSLREHSNFVTCRCPACARIARRETDTLDCHFDVLWIYMASAVPPADRQEQLFDHPELKRWLPVSQFVQGSDQGAFVLAERMVAKALRDLGVLAFSGDGEPYGPTVVHGMVQQDGKKLSKHQGNAFDLKALIDEAGADAIRLAVLYAAAPAKSFSWHPSILKHMQTFLAALWTFAKPRLSETNAAHSDLEIEASTRLRRRLSGWCCAATERISENIDRSDGHRAVRNAMVLLERIKDFERLVLERRAGLTDQDRDAVATALLILIRLLAPMAPHIAEELWETGGQDGLVVDASWPCRA